MLKKDNKAFLRKIIGSVIAFFMSLLSIIKSITGEGIFSKWYVIIILIAMAIALLGIMIYDIIECYKKRKKFHVFEVGSKEFLDFFSTWYEQQGKLAIVCNDLDWIVQGNDSRIYNVLVQKSENKQLTLFLGGGASSKYAQELEQKGAVLKKAAASIISKYIFSCLAPMDHYSNIILRCKRNDNNQLVEFVEIEDEQIIDLVNTVLEEGQQNCQAASKI